MLTITEYVVGKYYMVDKIILNNKKFFGKRLELSGQVGCRINNSGSICEAEISIDKLRNNQSSGKTGTLRIRLKALENWYNGTGSIEGFLLC